MDHKQGAESMVAFFPESNREGTFHKASAGWIRAAAMVEE